MATNGMMNGAINGKMLNVRLNSGTLEVEQIPEDMYRKHLGGYGIGARLMFDRIPAGADPLGPENVLGLFPGLLTGTPFFGIRYQAVSGNEVIPTATVEVEVAGERRSASAVGNGPLDAALKAADTALGSEVELLELHTRAVRAGTDAVAEVVVRVRQGEYETSGQAASTDSIEAALKAYLSAVGAARRAEEQAA